MLKACESDLIGDVPSKNSRKILMNKDELCLAFGKIFLDHI